MAQGISVHIGLNRVDPDHYEGWDGQLAACEADAKDMVALAKKQGFKSARCCSPRPPPPTPCRARSSSAAKTLKSGDLFFLTYSGHGGQVDDTNSDEKDRMDETWVCYDRQLVDDELYELWGKFKSGVRIVVLSDSCHSGTVLREIPAFVSGGPRIRAMPTVCRAQGAEGHTRRSTARSRTSIRAAENDQGQGKRAADLGLHGQSDVEGRRTERAVHRYAEKGLERGKVRGRLSQAARHDRVEDAAGPDARTITSSARRIRSTRRKRPS